MRARWFLIPLAAFLLMGADKGGEISGQVLWPDGAPFDGGTIELREQGAELWGRSVAVVAPDDGRFRFTGLSGRQMEIIAVTRVTTMWSIFVRVEEIGRWSVRAGDRGLRLRFPEAGRPLLHVRVEDERGVPVRKGVLLIDLVGEFDAAGTRTVPVKDGVARCLLRGPAQRVILTVGNAIGADGKGLGRTLVGPVAISPAPILIRLPKERVLRGRFVDEQGNGVAGVHYGAYHPPPLADFYGGWQFPGHGCWCCWDSPGEDGRFEIRCLGPGPLRLAVKTDGQRDWERMWWRGDWVTHPEIPVPDRDEDLTVVLKRGVYPAVRAVDPEGRPVPVSGVRMRRGWDWREDFRADEGVSRPGPLDPDLEYTIVVTASGGDRKLARGVRRSWKPADTTFRLEWAEAEEEPGPAPETPEGTPLNLRIDYGSKQRIPYVYGEIVPEDGGPALRAHPSVPEGRIEGLDATKSYTLRLIGIGAGLALEAKGLRPGPRVVDLTARPGARIAGRVVLPPGAEKLSVDATRGRLSADDISTRIIHRDGRFEFYGLLPGRWKVHVRCEAGGKDYTAEVELATGGAPASITVRPEAD